MDFSGAVDTGREEWVHSSTDQVQKSMKIWTNYMQEMEVLLFLHVRARGLLENLQASEFGREMGSSLVSSPTTFNVHLGLSFSYRRAHVVRVCYVDIANVS